MVSKDATEFTEKANLAESGSSDFDREDQNDREFANRGVVLLIKGIVGTVS